MKAPQELLPDLAPALSVKIVGLGGIGSVLVRYLVPYLAVQAPESRVVLIDGDHFEPRNAERMLFSRCGPKADVVADDLGEAAASVALAPLCEFVTPANIGRLVRGGDVVFLAVDNHATRKLVSDHCERLADVCLVSGGNDGVGEDSSGRALRGTWGNVQVHLRRSSEELTPAITRFHPEIADPTDALPGDVSCTEAMITTPQLLFTNLAVASAMLNTFHLLACRALHYAELGVEVAEGLSRPTMPLLAGSVGFCGRA